MSKKLKFTLSLVVCLGFIIAVSCVFLVTAQEPFTGEWKASVKEGSADKIQLSFERHSAKGNRQQMSQGYPYSELQGLTREQATAGGPVRFSLNREAGRIDCEGSFQSGVGSGTFRFTPNASFVSAMKAKGFDFQAGNSEDRFEEKIFAAAALNVTTALADDLVASGFTNLGVEDLFKAAIFNIDSKFMQEMKASGFANLSMEDLVKARIFKIDAAFVSQVAQMGFDKEPFENLVKLQIFKVTPEFIAEVRSEGLTNLSLEEAVKLRIFKIDANYIRQAKGEGAPTDVESLVRRKIGVSKVN